MDTKPRWKKVHLVQSRYISLLLVALLLAATGTTSRAQSQAAKKQAETYYNAGLTQYNLGNFKAAIEYYKKGYIELPDPAFLFNIAQAYRQIGDCRNALFFYRRFLSSAKNTPQRKEVEARIRELDESCRKLDESKAQPPNALVKPHTSSEETAKTSNRPKKRKSKSSRTSPQETVTTYDDGDTTIHSKRYEPRVLSSRISAGVAYIPTDLGKDSVPAQFSFAAGVGYPLRIGPLDFDFGGMLTLTPVPWESTGTDAKTVTSMLTGVLANVGVGYAIIPKLSIRGELGIGTLILSGLKAGNVFTDNGKASDGLFALFNLRMGFSLEYAVTKNLVLTASPLVFAYSPAIEELREEIDSLTRFDFMAGVGYRI